MFACMDVIRNPHWYLCTPRCPHAPLHNLPLYAPAYPDVHLYSPRARPRTTPAKDASPADVATFVHAFLTTSVRAVVTKVRRACHSAYDSVLARREDVGEATDG